MGIFASALKKYGIPLEGISTRTTPATNKFLNAQSHITGMRKDSPFGESLKRFGILVDKTLEPILNPLGKIAGKRIMRPLEEAGTKFRQIHPPLEFFGEALPYKKIYGESFGEMTRHKRMQILNIEKTFPLKEGATPLERKVHIESLSRTYKQWKVSEEGFRLESYFNKYYTQTESEVYAKMRQIKGTGSTESNKVSPIKENRLKDALGRVFHGLKRVEDMQTVMREAMFIGQDPTQRIAEVADRWTGIQSFTDHSFKGIPKVIRRRQDIEDSMAGDMETGLGTKKMITTPSSVLWEPTVRVTKRGTGYDKPRIKVEQSMPEFAPPLQQTFYRIRTSLKSKPFNVKDSTDTEELFRRLNAFGVAY